MESNQKRWTELREAQAAGRFALLAFAKVQQASRDARADEQWQGYRLFFPGHADTWTEIQTPEGKRYRVVRTPDGLRFPECPDQLFVDAINEALSEFGWFERVMTKHARIAKLRIAAASRGELERQEVAPRVVLGSREKLEIASCHLARALTTKEFVTNVMADFG